MEKGEKIEVKKQKCEKTVDGPKFLALGLDREERCPCP
jgi:hypothetical protein